MKKHLVTLFFLLTGAFLGFAQKMPYTAQEFALREVILKENSNSFAQQLQFSFRIYGKYAASQLLDESGGSWSPNYELRFWLANANGDTLVPEMADLSLQQRFSFFSVDTGKYRSYSFGHTISFPYKAFRHYGQQTFSLWAQPQSPKGDIKLAPFKTGSYTVSIPHLHDITEQRVQVKSAGATETATGVTVKYTCQFQYSAAELYSDGETSDEVIFYAEFTKPDGTPVTLVNDPQAPQNGKNSPRYSTQHQSKNVLSGEMQVPYTLFYLPEGVQELQYTIHAVTANGTQRWENLYRSKCMLHMPPMYLARVVIKNIQVTDRSYDVAAKDIPIIGLFVSSKSSRGQGHPELFWKFGSEGREILSSGMVDNSLYASDDSCFFQMTENERLTLGVYDYDMLSFNDKLAFFTFPAMRGDNTYRQNNLSSGDVIGGQILIERKRRPGTPSINLYVQATQNEGVSGYKIWGKVTDNSSLVQTKLFLRQPDGTNLIPAFQKIAVPADAAFAGFIPAWEYPTDAKVGLLITDKQYNMPLAQQYVLPDKRLTESRDVQLKVAEPQVITKNGVHGIQLKVTANYPTGITSKSAFRFLYSLRETGGVDLKPLVEKGLLKGSPLCDGQDCTFTVFVPYFLLSQFSGKVLHAVFGTEIQVTKNQFTIGKNESTLTLTVPTLQPAPTAEFSTNLKFKKSWSYVEIATEYNGQKRVLVKERAEGGKFTQEIQFPAESVYGQDTLSLVITPYEFRTPQGEIRWRFTADELKNAGILKLAKSTQAKKSTLKVH